MESCFFIDLRSAKFHSLRKLFRHRFLTDTALPGFSVFLFCVFYTVCTVAIAENLLKNPSFEEFNGSKIANWSTVGNDWYAEPKGSGLSSVAIDKVTVHGVGQASIRIDGNGKRCLLSQVLSYDPAWGRKLSFAGWMKFQNMKRGDFCKIQVGFLGENGTWLGSCGMAGDWRKKDLKDWEFFKTQINIPDGTKKLFVSCQTIIPNNGTVWFDNLSLEILPAETVAGIESRPADIDALLPIDDLSNPELKWSGQTWGDSPDVGISMSKEDAAMPEAGFIRFNFPDSRANEAVHRWNYSGEWIGLAFSIRRIAGSGTVSLYYKCGDVRFRAAEILPTASWAKINVPNSQVRYVSGAKSDSEKIFNPGKIDMLIFSHGKAIEFDIKDLGIDVRNELAIRSAYTDHKANILGIGDKGVFRTEIFNAYSEAQKFSLVMEIRNKRQKLFQETTTDITQPARSYRRMEFNLDVLPMGYYTINLKLIQKGRILSETVTGLCVLPPPAKTSKYFMGASGFGIGRKTAEIGYKLGVQAAEICISWKDCEPEPGIYKLDKFEEILDAYERYGIETVGMIRVSPDIMMPGWASAAPTAKKQGRYFAKNPGDFSRFVEAVVGRYKNRIHKWFFGCEVDLSVNNWAEGFDGYIAMLKAGSEGAKRADPDCLICGIGVSCNDAPELPVARKLWDSLGKYLDGIYFDPYTGVRYFGPDLPLMDPEKWDPVIYRNAAALLGIPASGKHLAVSEKGWAIDNTLSVDDPLSWDMADVLARSYILARSMGFIEHYMWFQLLTAGLEAKKYSYSLFRIEAGHSNPRPAAAAYAFVAGFLADVEPFRQILLHDDLHVYIFRHGNGTRAALWTTLPNPVPVEFELPSTSRLTDLMGNEIARGKNPLQKIELSKSPIYLWDDTLSAEKVAAVLEHISINLPCAELSFSIQDIHSCQVRLKNLSSTEVQGILSIVPPEGWKIEQPVRQLKIKEQASVIIPFTLTDVPVLSPMYSGTFSISFEANGQLIKKEVRPVIFNVAKFKNHPAVDANLDKYAGMTPIKLEEQSYVSPTDAPPNGVWTGIDDLSVNSWVAWDEENLYFAAKVRDDIFIQERTGSAAWMGDSIQLALDPLNNAVSAGSGSGAGYDSDDSEFTLALTPKGPQVFQSIGSPDGIGRLLADCKLVIRRDGDMIIYELALPWKVLGREPKAGMIFRFNFIAIDMDKSGGGLCWMGLTHGICNGKNPGFFHNFILGE